MNALAMIISLKGGHSNILATLEMSGCLPSELYIYPTTFMPTIQNCDLFPETVAPTLSRLVKIVSNP